MVIGNLEGAVGTVLDTVNSTNFPIFAIDSSDILLLANAGFKVMGIENNHSYDLGNEGKQNTIAQLLKNEIHPVCFENSPYFISVKGLVISIIEGNVVTESVGTQINIYPNPTTGELKIESGELKVEKVEILDITGRAVLTSHETTLNISQLSAGTYFVKLKTDKGELTKKVIKE